MSCKWDILAGQYGWWKLTYHDLHKCAGLLVIVCGVDMGPLAIAMPENGSRFAPAMGLDGVVWRSGSD